MAATKTAAALLAALACAACARAPARPASVLWITIDTLRADRLGCYGHALPTSPAIDALAARGARFERAYTPAPWTLPAVVSMLTGELPSGHGVDRADRSLRPAAPSVPRALRDAGFGTGAVVSGRFLRRSSGLAAHFGLWDESQAQGVSHLSTPGVADAAGRMLDRLAARERPFLLLAHFFEPHYLYRDHPELDFAPPPRPGGATGAERYRDLVALGPDPDPADRARLLGLYDEEVRVADGGVARLMEDLAARGELERTLVAVTADHGEAFYEHGWLGHTIHLHEELVRVPLVLAGPGVPAGLAVDEPVSTRELGLALAELAGAPVPGAAPTRLAALARGEAPAGAAPPVVSEVDWVDAQALQPDARRRALVRGDAKLVVDELAGTRQLFDLARDPGEREDLADREPELVRELERELERALAAARARRPRAAARELDAEERAALSELGYAGAGE